MMQIFNFVNARKIDDSLNTFSNITHSPIFVAVVFIIIVLQFIIVTVGSVAFKVTIFVRCLNNPRELDLSVGPFL